MKQEVDGELSQPLHQRLALANFRRLRHTRGPSAARLESSRDHISQAWQRDSPSYPLITKIASN